jgi:tetratricopeptide (TPR) repeat protein
VLRLASVIGREFTRPLLEKLHPNPSHLHGALENLTRQDLIHPLRVVPEPAYLFKHALVQDVVYETLLLSQRKSLHERVGAAIEALYADRIEEHYEALAGHYSKSDNSEKAVEYLEKAGDKAAGICSLVEARRAYHAAMKKIDGLAQNQDTTVKRIDVSLKWVGASQYAASKEHITHLGESLVATRALQDHRREAQVTYWLGRMHYVFGNMRLAIPLFETCIQIGKRFENDEILAVASVAIGRMCWLTGEQHRGIEYLENGIPMVERLGNLEEAAYSYGILGSIYSWVGRFQQGLSNIERGIAIARENKLLTREILCLAEIAKAKYMIGDWSSVHSWALKSLGKAQQTGNSLLIDLAKILVGYGAFMQGEQQQGLAMMEIGALNWDKSDSHFGLTLFGGMYAEASLLVGLSSEGMKWAEKVFGYSGRGERIGLPVAHRAKAVGWTQQADPEWAEAEGEIQSSLRVAREFGQRPDLAVTHFRYAEILHKKADHPAALAQLAEAEKLFAEMEMTWWSEQAAGLRTRIEGGKPFVWFAPYVDGPPKV